MMQQRLFFFAGRDLEQKAQKPHAKGYNKMRKK
jgi:hypothetical protein